MYMKLFNILERNIISGYITEVTLKYISVSDNSSIFEEYSHWIDHISIRFMREFKYLRLIHSIIPSIINVSEIDSGHKCMLNHPN